MQELNPYKDDGIRARNRRQRYNPQTPDMTRTVEMYDGRALGLPDSVLVAIVEIGESIFKNCLEALKPLDETGRYLFEALLSSFGDRLKTLCKDISGDVDAPIPMLSIQIKSGNVDASIKPEEVGLPKRTILEIEAIADNIEKSVINVIKALTAESLQHDVLALMASFNERLSELVGNLGERPCTDFRAMFPLTEMRAGRFTASKDGNVTAKIIGFGGASRTKIQASLFEAAEKRSFTLPQVISMLNNPNELSPNDLGNIYYFLFLKANIGSNRKKMFEVMRKDLAASAQQKPDNVKPFSNNAPARAYSRTDRTYTEEDRRVISALKAMAERFQRIEQYAEKSLGETAA